MVISHRISAGNWTWAFWKRKKNDLNHWGIYPAAEDWSIFLLLPLFSFLLFFWDKVSLCSLVDVLAATILSLGLGLSWSELAPWKDRCNSQFPFWSGFKGELCWSPKVMCHYIRHRHSAPHSTAWLGKDQLLPLFYISILCVYVWKEVSTGGLVAMALAVILWAQFRLVSLVLLPGSTVTKFETFMVCVFKGM